MNTLVFLNQITPLLQSILLIAALVGSVFVFKNTRKSGIVKIQSDTIEAQQQQIDTLKDQVDLLTKKYVQLDYTFEIVKDALKKKGIVITIDGDLISLQEGHKQTVIRNKPKTTATTVTTRSASVVTKAEATDNA